MFFMFLVLLWAPDLQAPEITGRDIFGFDPYRIDADGAIVDGEGAVKGWIGEDTVYDARWNPRYRIDRNKLFKVAED
jgi:hypothetical protein